MPRSGSFVKFFYQMIKFWAVGENTDPVGLLPSGNAEMETESTTRLEKAQFEHQLPRPLLASPHDHPVMRHNPLRPGIRDRYDGNDRNGQRDRPELSLCHASERERFTCVCVVRNVLSLCHLQLPSGARINRNGMFTVFSTYRIDGRQPPIAAARRCAILASETEGPGCAQTEMHPPARCTA